MHKCELFYVNTVVMFIKEHIDLQPKLNLHLHMHSCFAINSYAYSQPCIYMNVNT